MRLTRFGTVDLSEYNAQDSLGVSARNSLIPLRNGSFDLDGNSVYFQPNTLARSTVFYSDNDESLDELQKELLAELGKGRMLLEAVDSDDIEYVTFAKVLNVARGADAKNYNCERPLTVQWTQNYPFWTRKDSEPLYLDHGYFLDETGDNEIFLDNGYWQQAIVYAPDDFSETITLQNFGDMPTNRVYISIFPNFSSTNVSATNLTITNHRNGTGFTYNGSVNGRLVTGLEANDRIDIDVLTKTVWKNGSPDTTPITIPNNQIEWFRIEPGFQSVTVEFEDIQEDNESVIVSFSYAFPFL